MEGKSRAWVEDYVVTAEEHSYIFSLGLDDSSATESVLISRSPDRNILTDLGSPPIPTRAFCIAKGDLEDISLFGSEISRNLVFEEIFSMFRLGNTRPLPGHSSIGSISTRKTFVLAYLHPPRSPTREAVFRSSGKKQARRLPGVHLEYNATASGRGTNG
ncbi:hypothetical protein TNCV_2499361 [Trichonephila clavipes]|nr:hypothetical protein TNCV_2499361 [Trichonephila clavipes]